MNKYLSLAAIIAFAYACNNTGNSSVDQLQKDLLGVWEQDSKEPVTGKYSRTGHQDSIRKDTSLGYKLNFRELYVTDDNSPSGEKLRYTVRPDSVVALSGKYHLKIIKLTKDSLVYRMIGTGSDEFYRSSAGHIYRSHRVE